MVRTRRLQQLFSDERFQIGYGVFLILLIPTAIILSAFATITRYTLTIDVTLQRQALLAGRIFGSSVWEVNAPAQTLQERITTVAAANPDVLGLQVFTPAVDGAFTIIASLKPEQVGSVVSSPYYAIAWQQEENSGLATDYLGAPSVNGSPDPSLTNVRDRYWLVSLPLFSDVNGDSRRERVALLSLQLSSAVVDQQAEASWRSAIWGLTFTVLLAVLFLAAATRLWGYATLYRKIKEVDQMKDEFISIASHELRTPITAIRGYLSMALDGDFGKLAVPLHHGIERADASAKRLGDLVEDLLNVSRIEQGRMQLQRKPVEVVEAVRTIVDELKPTADAKKLALTLATSGAVKVQADPDKLKQVFINIVGNAIKYTEHGSVTVMLENTGSLVKVRVKDTGPGIAPENQERLFTKFYRVGNNDAKKIPGTGLGLWITKQLVELMKGKITLESIEGTGTQVTVTLPQAIAEAKPEQGRSNTENQNRSAKNQKVIS